MDYKTITDTLETDSMKWVRDAVAEAIAKAIDGICVEDAMDDFAESGFDAYADDGDDERMRRNLVGKGEEEGWCVEAVAYAVALKRRYLDTMIVDDAAVFEAMDDIGASFATMSATMADRLFQE